MPSVFVEVVQRLLHLIEIVMTVAPTTKKLACFLITMDSLITTATDYFIAWSTDSPGSLSLQANISRMPLISEVPRLRL